MRIPNIKATLFYIRIDDFLLILLSGVAKQLLVFIGKVDRFNKKFLGPFSVLDETIILS